MLEARDGYEALELSRAHEGLIDLVITDLVMPRVSGRELVRILGKERPDGWGLGEANSRPSCKGGPTEFSFSKGQQRRPEACSCARCH